MVSPGLRGCVLQKESKPSSTLLYTLTSLSTCENEGKAVTHKQITHRLGHTPYPRVETIVRAGLWGRWRNHKELVTSARVHFTPWALTLTSCVRFQVYFPGSKWAPAKEFFHCSCKAFVRMHPTTSRSSAENITPGNRCIFMDRKYSIYTKLEHQNIADGFLSKLYLYENQRKVINEQLAMRDDFYTTTPEL